MTAASLLITVKLVVQGSGRSTTCRYSRRGRNFTWSWSTCISSLRGCATLFGKSSKNKDSRSSDYFKIAHTIFTQILVLIQGNLPKSKVDEVKRWKIISHWGKCIRNLTKRATSRLVKHSCRWKSKDLVAAFALLTKACAGCFRLRIMGSPPNSAASMLKITLRYLKWNI